MKIIFHATFILLQDVKGAHYGVQILQTTKEDIVAVRLMIARLKMFVCFLIMSVLQPGVQFVGTRAAPVMETLTALLQHLQRKVLVQHVTLV